MVKILEQYQRKPGILDDTKSLNLKGNVRWSYHTVSKNLLYEKTLLCTKKLLVAGRNILLQEDTFCYKKKAYVIGRNFLSYENSYCHKKKFLSQKDNSCHDEKLPVTARNVLSQQEISCCHSKRFPVTGINFLQQERTACQSQIILFLYSKILSQCYEWMNCAWISFIQFGLSPSPRPKAWFRPKEKTKRGLNVTNHHATTHNF